MLLEPEEPEDRDQVPDMEGVEGRVEAVVGPEWAARREARRQPFRRRMEEPAPAELVEEPRHRALAGVVRGHRARSGVTPGAGRRVEPGSGGTGTHAPYAIVTDAMQTSLARRERRRRGASTRTPKGGAAVKRLAIIIPLILFTTIVLVGVLGVVSAVAAYNIYANNLPTADQIKSVLENIDFSQTTRVYDRSGKIQLATFAREQRDVVTFDQIAPVLVDATTAAEDKTFWQNAGFDPVGIISAGLDTLSGRGRGASTITQQIVRNRLLPDWAKEGTVYDRKIREIIVSVRLTEVYKGDVGKQQIIAAYLNDNFYGNRSYGVSAAARGYWNKPMSKLTLAQAALLAAIPKSPTAYDLLRNAVEQENTATKDPDDTLLVVPQDSPVVLYRNRILDPDAGCRGDPVDHAVHPRAVHRRRLRSREEGAGHPDAAGDDPDARAPVRPPGPP